MKKLLFFIISTIACTDLFAQDYLFVASYRLKDKGCSDKLLKEVPLKNSNDYDAIKRNFYRDNNISSPTMYLLKPGNAAIVYSFRTKTEGFPCEYLAHNIAYGKTIDEAKEEMNKTVAKNPRNFLSSPSIVITWTGKAMAKKETLERNYSDLKVEYTTTPSKSVIAKGRNTNKDVIAVIRFVTASGSLIKEIEVEPGTGFTEKIDESTFEVEVSFKPGKVTEPSTIDKIKKFIKDNISTNKDGEIKSSSIGVRG